MNDIKIGIFGDSWASHTLLNSPPAWPDLVRRKYFVDNYAEPGSSLYFSYEKFKIHHDKFDKVIFVATSSGRLLLPRENAVYHTWWDKPNGIDGNRKLHVNSLWTANNLLRLLGNKKEFDRDRLILQACADYFMYVYNIDEHRNYSKLMIEDIRRIRPDALVIPTTIDSYIEGFEDDCLHEIMLKKEYEFWNVDHDELLNLNKVEHRSCHMCRENNEILAEKVIHWIETGEFSKLTHDDFVNPSDPWTYYFR